MASDNSLQFTRLDKLNEFERSGGDITTLLDLTPRDFQDNHMFPLSADKTWWLPDSRRRLDPFQSHFRSYRSVGQHPLDNASPLM